MDLDIVSLMAASWDNRASNDEKWSPICVFLLNSPLSRLFIKHTSLIVDLLAYHICNFSHASLHDWHSWFTRSEISPKPEIVIATACSSIVFSTVLSSDAGANPRLCNAAFAGILYSSKSLSCVTLNLGNLATYLFSTWLENISLLFPNQRGDQIKFNVTLLIFFWNLPVKAF